MVLAKAPVKKTEQDKSVSNLLKMNEKKSKLTRIVINYDVGFSNNLFIRGNGANLSWSKGIMLRNTGSDEWTWEMNQTFDSCEFKVLVNDSHYEQGDNHLLTCGDCIQYTPQF